MAGENHSDMRPGDACETPDSEYDELHYPEPQSFNTNPMTSHVNFSRDAKDGHPLGLIPYSQVLKQPVPLKRASANIYISGAPITVRIVSHARTESSVLNVNPNLYVIEVHHGPFQWTVRRRYKHFQDLHQQLGVLKATLAIPFPSQTHRERRRSFRTTRRESRGNQAAFPRFPKRPEILIAPEDMEVRMQQLENYLRAVLANKTFREYHGTLSFLEISPLSFVDQLGQKGKEGLVKKRAGDQRPRGIINPVDRKCCAMCCCCLHVCLSCDENCGQWNERWMVVKDTWVGYIRPDTGELGCVILMDHGFTVKNGVIQTGVTSGVQVQSLSRQLLFKAWTKRKADEWAENIQLVANSTGREFTQPNRFDSFAPVRSGLETMWFVDGAGYMSAVADALEAAREEIYIADWWLSPEIYMKRPVLQGNYWRLDSILKRKAEQGVRVFVLLYKEVKVALGINSLYSKHTLAKQHPNIKVIRHPDHVTGGVLFWAHHEKLVVVDQSVAFLGGIDLCYGRWDDQKHRLTDLGGVSVPVRSGGGVELVKTSHTAGQNVPTTLLRLVQSAQTVTNSTIAETALRYKMSCSDEESAVEDAKDLEVDAASREKGDSPRNTRTARVISRMRTIRDKGRVWAEEVRGKTRLFTGGGKEWMDRHLPGLREGGSELGSEEPEGSADVPNEDFSESTDPLTDETDTALKKRKQSADIQNHNEIPSSFTGKLWIGKDYTNFIVKDFSRLDLPFQDTVDRTNTPRMPWHDIGIAVCGSAARDAARHFIQRWNAVKAEKFKDNPSYQYLVPKSYDDFSSAYQVQRNSFTLTDCQVLRSASDWSVGIKTTESSIQRAYVDAIENSQHYIYIENQFFVSIAGPSDEVTNRIAKSLFERIRRAHREGTRFRVYVVMPLLPGFEGQVGAESGTAIRCITHWNYASICRGPTSLLGRLKGEGIPADEYVMFAGLRGLSELNGQLVTELIYVHSKLMIVDDVTVICGSANINDRSMNGKRDSELALITHDIDLDDSVMDGKPYKAGRFASSLRRSLFREHLGLDKHSSIDLRDPVCDDFFQAVWNRAASTNSSIFETVFRCLPSDSVTSLIELATYQNQLPLAFTDPKGARQLVKDIQGNIVVLPLNFLCKENLKPAAGTAEALLPSAVWT